MCAPFFYAVMRVVNRKPKCVAGEICDAIISFFFFVLYPLLESPTISSHKRRAHPGDRGLSFSLIPVLLQKELFGVFFLKRVDIFW